MTDLPAALRALEAEMRRIGMIRDPARLVHPETVEAWADRLAALLAQGEACSAQETAALVRFGARVVSEWWDEGELGGGWVETLAGECGVTRELANRVLSDHASTPPAGDAESHICLMCGKPVTDGAELSVLHAWVCSMDCWEQAADLTEPREKVGDAKEGEGIMPEPDLSPERCERVAQRIDEELISATPPVSAAEHALVELLEGTSDLIRALRQRVTEVEGERDEIVRYLREWCGHQCGPVKGPRAAPGGEPYPE